MIATKIPGKMKLFEKEIEGGCRDRVFTGNESGRALKTSIANSQLEESLEER